MQFETIRTSSDSNNCCGNIYSANFILAAIEHTIWTALFIFGLGRFIFSENHWQIYENYNLLFVAFFVIFGSWGLEIYGISGTKKSNFFAMFFVLAFSLIRCFLAIYFICYTVPTFQLKGAQFILNLLVGIAVFIRISIQKEIVNRIGKGLKRQQCYEEIWRKMKTETLPE